MSNARLVITAVRLEKRPVAEVAATYGVARSWIYALLKRYDSDGDAAFEPRSRRPHRSPTATPPEVVDLVLSLRADLTGQGLDAGPQTLAWHLAQHHAVRVSPATISRITTRAGLVTPAPHKRPKASLRRFAADLPNQMWQTDATHWHLTPARKRNTTGPATKIPVEILSFLDDHSRYLLTSRAFTTVTGPAVVQVFRDTVDQHGCPASVLSDNGLVFTTRFAGNAAGRGNPNGFQTELARLGVVQKNSSPAHPQTCGKIERWHATLKRWLNAQPPAATLPELQAQLDAFRGYYNDQRPHRGIDRRTPRAAYTSRPKATPPTGPRPEAIVDRVRADVIDSQGKVTLRHHGRLHHIGIGRTHARTRVLILAHGLHIRVIAHTTGELLRELILNPDIDYQPQNTGHPEP